MLIKLNKRLNKEYPDIDASITKINILCVIAANGSVISIKVNKGGKIDIEYGTHEYMYDECASTVDEAMDVIEPLLDGKHPRINLQY